MHVGVFIAFGLEFNGESNCAIWKAMRLHAMPIIVRSLCMSHARPCKVSGWRTSCMSHARPPLDLDFWGESKNGVETNMQWDACACKQLKVHRCRMRRYHWNFGLVRMPNVWSYLPCGHSNIAKLIFFLNWWRICACVGINYGTKHDDMGHEGHVNTSIQHGTRRPRKHDTRNTFYIYIYIKKLYIFKNY